MGSICQDFGEGLREKRTGIKGRMRVRRAPVRSKGEILMGEILDYLFPGEVYEQNFRPEWLEGLELDRHYPELNVAFEFQGDQHSAFVPRFHRSLNDLYTQRARDRKKRGLCTRKKIFLVTIKSSKLAIGLVASRIMHVVRCKTRRDWLQAEYLFDMAERYRKNQPGAKTLNKRCRGYRQERLEKFQSREWVKKSPKKVEAWLRKKRRSRRRQQVPPSRIRLF